MSADSKKVYEADVEEHKMIAALSYIWILFLIPLLLKRDSKFAQFHARQGLVLCIVEIVGSLVFWIPVVGQILFLIVLIIAIIGFAKTLQGEWWQAPIIHRFSQKIKL